jgi:hypothetical protein
MALRGYLASVKAMSSGTSMTDEATTTSNNISYQITATNKRILDLNTPVLVEDGGVATIESFTVDYINGIITFESVDTRTITISGKYVTPVTIATANSFGFSGAAESLDNTVFGSAYKQFESGLISGTATLGMFYVVDNIFVDSLLDGSVKLVEYYVSPTKKITFYGVLTGDTVDSTVGGLITESVTFQITTQMGAN